MGFLNFGLKLLIVILSLYVKHYCDIGLWKIFSFIVSVKSIIGL